MARVPRLIQFVDWTGRGLSVEGWAGLDWGTGLGWAGMDRAVLAGECWVGLGWTGLGWGGGLAQPSVHQALMQTSRYLIPPIQG